MLQTATPRAKAAQVFTPAYFSKIGGGQLSFGGGGTIAFFPADGIEQGTAQAGRIRYGYDCHGIDVRPCLKLYHGGHVGDGIFQIGVEQHDLRPGKVNNNLHRHNRWRALP